ncbi:MAG: SpoIIE family protein phosphatase [Candidatus Gracilibacteria bacterium]|jgi:serine phosphatase RsbU (regulator of sigma subunit)
MRSIKTKLTITISILIVVLLTAAAFVLLNEKRQELSNDIFLNARSFAELTAPNIVNDYNLYLSQKSFIYFNRNIQDVFQKNVDVASVQIYKYNGELAYDSHTEQSKQYDGTVRKVQNDLLFKQIQARNLSVLTTDSKRVVYFKKDENGNFQAVDQDEKTTTDLGKTEKISYFVQPVGTEFAVSYGITYQALEARVNQTAWRIILLAIFGVGIGILMAVLYSKTITKPIEQLTEGAGIIAKGDFKHRVIVKTKDELFTLAGAFNKMAADLEISTKAMLYKERVTKELELASKIQAQLLPKTMPIINGLDLAAGLLPAEEIGGDCYDFLKLNDDQLIFYIGDVTGHGVPSGIIVSIANAVIYTMAGQKDLKSIMMDTNRVIKAKTSSNMFLTMVMLQWDAVSSKLKFVNAGHEQMIHYHAQDQKVTLCPSGGLALGMIPDISKVVKEEEFGLQKDDVLVLYSDGIPESWKNDKEMYGMARFKRAVTEYSSLPTALAIRNALLADVKEFSGSYKQMDDITLIVVKRK